MYCKHCGTSTQPGAAVCLNCGVFLGTGNRFCQNCGNATDPMATVCTHCGASLLIQPVGAPGTYGKSRLAAGIMAIIFGYLGIHNFYMGYTGKAIAQLLITVCSCFLLSPVSAIWGIVEGILIFSGNTNVDANGIPLKE